MKRKGKILTESPSEARCIVWALFVITAFINIFYINTIYTQQSVLFRFNTDYYVQIVLMYKIFMKAVMTKRAQTMHLASFGLQVSFFPFFFIYFSTNNVLQYMQSVIYKVHTIGVIEGGYNIKQAQMMPDTLFGLVSSAATFLKPLKI